MIPTTTDQDINDPGTQGSVTPTPKSAEKVIECRTPAPSHQDIDTQELDWPDMIPVKIPPQPNQHIKQSIPMQPTRHNIDPAEIPQLEENSEEEQYQDLETYLTHHNVFKASQRIHIDYRSRLLELDDDRYYQEIDIAYHTYGTPPPPQLRTIDQQIRLPVPTEPLKN